MRQKERMQERKKGERREKTREVKGSEMIEIVSDINRKRRERERDIEMVREKIVQYWKWRNERESGRERVREKERKLHIR